MFERIMTQAQPSMQECLIVLARSVQVLNQPLKTGAIECWKCSLNVDPSWRNVFLFGHAH